MDHSSEEDSGISESEIEDYGEDHGSLGPVANYDPDPSHCQEGDKKFVWPWKAIVVNIPTRFKNGRYVGESGSRLRDELRARGFNVKRVRPLWNCKGHSGMAFVEFEKDWVGFKDALLFEKEYELNNHGKQQWETNFTEKSGMYAWVAREDDYKEAGVVGEHLQKVGDLKSIAELTAEEARKTKKLISHLTNTIENKNRNLISLETRFNQTTFSVMKLMQENDQLHQAHNQDARKLNSINLQNKKMKYMLKAVDTRLQQLIQGTTKAERSRSPICSLQKQKMKAVGNSITLHIRALKTEMEERKEEVHYLQNLSQTLDVKERMNNKELLEARNELVTSLGSSLTNRTMLRNRRMGELNSKPFRDACSLKFSQEDWESRCAEVCSLWEGYLRETNWQPFKHSITDGKSQEVIDENDARMVELRNEWGDEVYKAVADALLELNEYNPSGRYPLPEIWNCRDDRKASLKEIIGYMTKQGKSRKRRRCYC